MGYSHERRRKLRSRMKILYLRHELQKGWRHRNFLAIWSESMSKGVSITDDEIVKFLMGRIVIELV